MSRNSIMLTLMVVTSNAITSTFRVAVAPGGNNIESTISNGSGFIDSLKNLVGGRERRKRATVQESLYYLSQIAAAHEMANTECVNIFGPEGGLVSIESAEELRNITTFLRESGDSATLYWTSGRLNMDDDVFEGGNGVHLSPSLPWSTGHPSSQVSRYFEYFDRFC